VTLRFGRVVSATSAPVRLAPEWLALERSAPERLAFVRAPLTGAEGVRQRRARAYPFRVIRRRRRFVTVTASRGFSVLSPGGGEWAC
jgi:hypothetical protein